MLKTVLSWIPDVLALAGVIMVIHAMFLLATWLGWLVAGAACLVVAWLGAAAERRRKAPGGAA